MTKREPDPWVRCGATTKEVPKGWPLRRDPKCNRPVHHDGDHMEHERRTFALLHRWPQQARVTA